MTFQIEIDHVNEKNRSVQKLPRETEPKFARHEPDLDRIRSAAEDHDFENLIVIGNGGSITSFRAYLYAFLHEIDVHVRVVTTMDPDYLNSVAREMDPESTLVMPISKSGETASGIEALLYFIKRGYEVFGVTSDNSGALRQIIEKRDYGWIEHPDIGGRFSGATETALVPAAFCGMPVGEIRNGAEEMYGKLSPENQYNAALNTASAIYDAEQDGHEFLFAGFYSTRMFGFFPLLVQLVHETVCKDGRGPTVYGDLGPEFQHHTNQRIFGGKENTLSVFFRTDTHEREVIEVPGDLESVGIGGRSLSELQGNTYKHSLASEYRGVKETLDEEGMPNMTVNLTELSHESAGKLMAYLQYVSVYLAWLYEVDPFSQPDVEKSKRVGFDKRFGP